MSFQPEILAFCCNWCGYAGADLAGVNRLQYPSNIKIIRVLCSGRIEPGHIFKALELGIDGVMIIGCHLGDCHYQSGNEKAEQMTLLTENLLKKVGLGGRLRLEWVSASEGNRFSELVKGFIEDIHKLGPNPMRGNRFRKQDKDSKILENLNFLTQNSQIYYCLECGKCTASCPISRILEGFSPMRIVEKFLRGLDENAAGNKEIWTCLTCNICGDRCPSDVQWIDFIQGIRRLGEKKDRICAHSGVFQSISRIHANPKVKQLDRLSWVTEDMQISKKGKILYFTGCLPYFDIMFKNIKADSLAIARSTVRILNKAGITPVVLEDERCCGHDLLWMGASEAIFEDIARLNLKAIRETGAKMVVTSCPECYITLKRDYPRYIEPTSIDFEVIHTSELYAQLIEDKKITFNDEDDKGDKDKAPRVTYHDPCRLGRLLGVFDPPRTVISSIPGIELVEMERSRKNAICCGTVAWMNCGTVSKYIQIDRLREARATGADILVTACPKCQIHLKCAQNEQRSVNLLPEPYLEIRDLSVLVDVSLTTGGGAFV